MSDIITDETTREELIEQLKRRDEVIQGLRIRLQQAEEAVIDLVNQRMELRSKQ